MPLAFQVGEVELLRENQDLLGKVLHLPKLTDFEVGAAEMQEGAHDAHGIAGALADLDASFEIADSSTQGLSMKHRP